MNDLREQLTDIYRRTGELTPQGVVNEARPVEHPLHGRFEWDDEAAGEAYRRVQASELIRSVRVVYAEGTATDGPKSIRAFSSLREAGTGARRGYAPTEELVESDLTRKLLLRQCEREIVDLQRKYGHLREFADLLGQVTKAAS